MVENEANSLISLLDNLSLSDGSKAKDTGKSTTARAQSDEALDKSEEVPCAITITRQPRDHSRLLLQELGDVLKDEQKGQQQQAQCAAGARTTSKSQSELNKEGVKRPYIKKYHGLENCEGTRRCSTSNSNSNESSPSPSTVAEMESQSVRKIVVPDNLRPVGIQLETELMTTLAIFKSFTRIDGPALASKQVAKGDILVSIDGTSVEDIPTDTLIRMLQGQPQQQPLDTEKKSTTGNAATDVPEDQKPQDVRVFKFARKKTRGAVASLLAGLWTKATPASPSGVQETRTASTTS